MIMNSNATIIQIIVNFWKVRANKLVDDSNQWIRFTYRTVVQVIRRHKIYSYTHNQRSLGCYRIFKFPGHWFDRGFG